MARSWTVGVTLVGALLASPAPVDAAWFVRGDADGSGKLTITDPIRVLRFLFAGDGAGIGCRDAADADDSGAVDLTDAVYILEHLFLGAPPPGQEDLFRGCWYDGSADGLDCAAAAACQPMGVIFCASQSASMSGPPSLWLRNEIADGLRQFADGDRFGIILYAGGKWTFPEGGKPVTMAPEVRPEAIDWMLGQANANGACVAPALYQSIDWATGLDVTERMIIYISNGLASCMGQDQAVYTEAILGEMKARNTDSIPVRVIGIGFEIIREEWLQELAGQSGGEYTRVET